MSVNRALLSIQPLQIWSRFTEDNFHTSRAVLGILSGDSSVGNLSIKAGISVSRQKDVLDACCLSRSNEISIGMLVAGSDGRLTHVDKA